MSGPHILIHENGFNMPSVYWEHFGQAAMYERFEMTTLKKVIQTCLSSVNTKNPQWHRVLLQIFRTQRDRQKDFIENQKWIYMFHFILSIYADPNEFAEIELRL